MAGNEISASNHNLLRKDLYDHFNRSSRGCTPDRYYFVPSDAAGPDQRRVSEEAEIRSRRRLEESKTSKYMPCYDPSTGAVIAYAPQCTAAEVEEAIQTAAAKLFPAWRDTPVTKRVQVLFKMKQLLDEHLDELTYLLPRRTARSGMKPWATCSRSSRWSSLPAARPR